MAKRMTVVFDDDELYTTLKVEAARSGRHAKDIVAEALRQYFALEVAEPLVTPAASVEQVLQELGLQR